MSTLDSDPTIHLPRTADGLDAHNAATTTDHHAPRINVTRLWAGGAATAVVAALIGLVGALVVRAVLRVDPAAMEGVAAAFGSRALTVLCPVAAGAALAATGIGHALMIGTPRPLGYFGWFVGLFTAAAALAPLTMGAPLAIALASGAVYLVIGLAIGSLVSQAMISASRHALD